MHCILVKEVLRDKAGAGPVVGRWNKYLELKFPLRTRRDGPTSFAALSKRVAVDQIVMAPIGVGPYAFFHPSMTPIHIPFFQLSIFLSSMGVMEGRDAKHIRARFEDIYRPVLLANWKIWPAAQVRLLSYNASCFGLADRWCGCGRIVYQFPVYALTLPRSVSTNMRRVLDALLVSS